MLKRLLKYDLTSIFKFLLIFYSLALFFGLSTRFFLSFDNSLALEIIGRICSGAAISMMFSIMINNMMRLWVRFKANFYSDESYLTHTLPIDRRTQYMSKFITAVITMLVSVLVIALTLFLAYYSKENMELVKSILFPIADSFNISAGILVAAMIGIIFLEFLNILQCGFTGIILGHRMLSGKVGLSVVFGFVVSSATQILLTAVLFTCGIFNKDIMNIFMTNGPLNFETFKLLTVISLIVYTVIVGAVCLINIKLFKRGVNVE